jgi:hypothetical protein
MIAPCDLSYTLRLFFDRPSRLTAPDGDDALFFLADNLHAFLTYQKQIYADPE